MNQATVIQLATHSSVHFRLLVEAAGWRHSKARHPFSNSGAPGIWTDPASLTPTHATRNSHCYVLPRWQLVVYAPKLIIIVSFFLIRFFFHLRRLVPRPSTCLNIPSRCTRPPSGVNRSGSSLRGYYINQFIPFLRRRLLRSDPNQCFKAMHRILHPILFMRVYTSIASSDKPPIVD